MYYMTPQGKFARRAESGCSNGSSSQQELKFHFMSILHHMKVRQMDKVARSLPYVATSGQGVSHKGSLALLNCRNGLLRCM